MSKKIITIEACINDDEETIVVNPFGVLPPNVKLFYTVHTRAGLLHMSNTVHTRTGVLHMFDKDHVQSVIKFDTPNYKTAVEYAETMQRFHGGEIVDNVARYKEERQKELDEQKFEAKNGLYLFDKGTYKDFKQACEYGADYLVGHTHDNIKNLTMSQVADILNVIHDTQKAINYGNYVPVIAFDDFVMDAEKVYDFNYALFCTRENCEAELQAKQIEALEKEPNYYTVKLEIDITASNPFEAVEKVNAQIYAPRTQKHEGNLYKVYEHGECIGEHYVE